MIGDLPADALFKRVEREMSVEVLQNIFYSDVGSGFNNFALLVFRLLLCYEMIRVHGLKKMAKAGGVPEIVPNPLGLPPKLNQLIADFSDLVAPVLVALGLATRISVLPILAVTLTGYFVVHRKDVLSVRDIPYMYSLSYLFIFLIGAGRFSVDYYLYRFFS
ncbi:MAG TPA: DoxX family protein [Pyrinomonadaceae bacterium]|jgi:putative oxidoreductase